jgi:hypothetical protein
MILLMFPLSWSVSLLSSGMASISLSVAAWSVSSDVKSLTRNFSLLWGFSQWY